MDLKGQNFVSQFLRTNKTKLSISKKYSSSLIERKRVPTQNKITRGTDRKGKGKCELARISLQKIKFTSSGRKPRDLINKWDKYSKGKWRGIKTKRRKEKVRGRMQHSKEKYLRTEERSLQPQRRNQESRSLNKRTKHQKVSFTIRNICIRWTQTISFAKYKIYGSWNQVVNGKNIETR